MTQSLMTYSIIRPEDLPNIIANPDEDILADPSHPDHAAHVVRKAEIDEYLDHAMPATWAKLKGSERRTHIYDTLKFFWRNKGTLLRVRFNMCSDPYYDITRLVEQGMNNIGIEISVYGQPVTKATHGKAALNCSNHGSYFDFLYIGTAVRALMTGMSRIKKFPYVGNVGGKLNMFFVPRVQDIVKGRANDIVKLLGLTFETKMVPDRETGEPVERKFIAGDGMDRLREYTHEGIRSRLEAGHNVIFFPEGTQGPLHSLADYKDPAFRSFFDENGKAKPGMVVQPVHIDLVKVGNTNIPPRRWASKRAVLTQFGRDEVYQGGQLGFLHSYVLPQKPHYKTGNRGEFIIEFGDVLEPSMFERPASNGRTAQENSAIALADAAARWTLDRVRNPLRTRPEFATMTPYKRISHDPDRVVDPGAIQRLDRKAARASLGL